MGNEIEAAAHELLHYNVDKVFVYDAPELARFQIEPYTAVFENFIQTVKPSSILVGATTVGRQLAPRGCPYEDSLDRGLYDPGKWMKILIYPRSDRVAFGGNIMAHIKTPNHRPQMATVRYKIMNAPERAGERERDCVVQLRRKTSHGGSGYRV